MKVSEFINEDANTEELARRKSIILRSLQEFSRRKRKLGGSVEFDKNNLDYDKIWKAIQIGDSKGRKKDSLLKPVKGSYSAWDNLQYMLDKNSKVFLKYGIKYIKSGKQNFNQIKNKEVRSFAQKNENYKPLSKYLKIDAALKEPKVSFKIIKTTRTGPGGQDSDWKSGVQTLGQYLPKRKVTIPKSIKEIEDKLKKHRIKVTWDNMVWRFEPSLTRYGKDINLGADVLITGKTSNGKDIAYFYNSSGYAEGAQRYVIVDGQKLTFGEFLGSFSVPFIK